MITDVNTSIAENAARAIVDCEDELTNYALDTIFDECFINSADWKYYQFTAKDAKYEDWADERIIKYSFPSWMSMDMFHSLFDDRMYAIYNVEHDDE